MTCELQWEAFEIPRDVDPLNGHEVRVVGRLHNPNAKEAILRCRFRRGQPIDNLPAMLIEMQRVMEAAIERETGSAPG